MWCSRVPSFLSSVQGAVQDMKAASAGWVCTLWNDYAAGFPWHPHRGIETITYVLAGSVEHGDSLGNKGKMTDGDVQWMTAGSGILPGDAESG